MLRSRSLVLALAAGSTLPLAAHATVLNYASAVNGTASTAARWAPAQVPVAADDLVFNATAGAQAYSVTFDAATATSRTVTFNEDTVTLTMSSPHTTTNGLTIGSAVADNSTVTLSSGTWAHTLNSTTAYNIGNVGGSVGTLNITGDSADLLLTNASSRLRVGTNGTGTLSITGGGRAEMGAIIVASNSGSTGTLTVSGAQAVSPFQRSTLVGSSTTLLNSLSDSGSSTVSIANGALVDLAGDLDIARIFGTTSTVTIGGAGGIGNILDATLDVAGTVRLAANNTANVPGSVTITVNNNGQALVGGTLEVGNDPDGGTATLNINTGAVVQAGGVVDGAFGIINHGGGTLRINAGTYAGIDPMVVTGTGSPVLNLTGTFNQTLAPAGAVGLIVGNDAGVGTFTGILLIDGGADLNVGSTDINLGDDAGTTGDLTISGVGSTLTANGVNSDIRVGFNGTGNLDVLAGGSCNFRNLLVPGIDSGVGAVNVSGAGSTLTTQFLAIDNNLGSGSGTVQVQTSGTLSVTNAGFSTNIRNTGELIVADTGTFNTPGTVTIQAGGSLRIGGELHNATLVAVNGTLASNASASEPGLIDAPVHVLSGGEVEVNAADLIMGDSGDVNGVVGQDGSVISVGAHTLTLLDQNRATVDAVTINGGTIVAPNGLEIVTPGTNGTLDGTGTITAPELFMESGGSVITATTANGIVINGTFRNNSGMIDGTKYTFNTHPTTNAGGWTGAGTINAQVIFNAGTTVHALANMTMGDGSNFGVTFNSNAIVHMGPENLTLLDSNGCGAPALLDMDGGVLTSTNGLVVGNGDTLRGNGDIEVTNLAGSGLSVSGGTIDPDEFFTDTDTYHGVGHFSVNGRYTQTATGTYLCELAGFNNEFQPLNDKITCGPAVLAGDLDISLIDGYEPLLCHEFTVLQYTSRTGTWTTVNFPPGVNGGVRYEATRAVVFFNSVGCDDIDYNNDGLFPDTADIDDFLSVFSGGSCSTGTCSDIDFNNDCLFPDTTDIDSLLTVFSGGPCI